VDRSDEVRAFVAARGTAVSRTAHLPTGNIHAAEDLVQETYVEMVRQGDDLSGLCSALTGRRDVA
jgi:DNA-directed RNA polymerase specialized sigma24 family protein